MPQKNWARSVQPFWRLLDTNKRTNTRRPSKVYITRLLKLLLQLLIVASVSIFSLYSIKQKQKKIADFKMFFSHIFKILQKKTAKHKIYKILIIHKPSRVMWCPTKIIIDKNDSDDIIYNKDFEIINCGYNNNDNNSHNKLFHCYKPRSCEIKYDYYFSRKTKSMICILRYSPYSSYLSRNLCE